MYLANALGKVTYNASTFSSNVASEKGGALAHEGVITAVMVDSQFTNNTALAGVVSHGLCVWGAGAAARDALNVG